MHVVGNFIPSDLNYWSVTKVTLKLVIPEYMGVYFFKVEVYVNTPLASHLGLLFRFFPKLCLVTRLIPPFLLCCVCLTVLVSAL